MPYRLQELHERGIPPLLEGIETKEAWEKKRENILSTWLEILGGKPEPVSLNYRVLSEEEAGGYIRQRILYDSVDVDQVPANLLIPSSLLSLSPSTSAAILALHPTNPAGKDDISHPKGRENRQYAIELARRGYVVLCPDTITAGERIFPGAEAFLTDPFYEQYPTWSAVGKMLVDHRQGINLLTSLPFVDSERIGVIGHSLGGYNSYFLAGLDKRIRAVVSSCGLSTFAMDPERDRWGRRTWFTHFPKVSVFLANGEVPFEFHEIAALVAPVPFFNWMGQKDSIFPHWQAIATAFYEINHLYEWLGYQDRFRFYMGNDGHDFPKEIRELSYRFLDKWLSKS